MQIGENGVLEQEQEVILQSIRRYLLSHYKPAPDPKTAELHYSTAEIYEKLYKLYPNPLFFRPAMVATWLEQAGFKFYEYGNLNFEWMLNKQ